MQGNCGGIRIGTIGSPDLGCASFTCGCRGFVATATRGWAKELTPDGIRVNAVSPGVIMTPFHDRFSTPQQLAVMQASIPMGRAGLAEECAGAFLYLSISPRSR